MEIQKSKLKFEYADEFGTSIKTEDEFDISVINSAGTSHFEYLVDRFKAFLKFSGFSESLVETIIIEEHEL